MTETSQALAPDQTRDQRDLEHDLDRIHQGQTLILARGQVLDQGPLLNMSGARVFR